MDFQVALLYPMSLNDFNLDPTVCTSVGAIRCDSDKIDCTRV